MIRKIKYYWNTWIDKRIPKGESQTVVSHAIYVLPTGFGWAYGFMVFSLFLSAINYQISAIFLLTFLLAIVGLMSAWEAHANLNQLQLRFLNLDDAECGKPVPLVVYIKPHQTARFSIELQTTMTSFFRLDKIPIEGMECTLTIPTTQRGFFQLPRITLSTTYPFGLFRTWSYIRFEKDYYVYPKTIDPGFVPQAVSLKPPYSYPNSLGDAEFYELSEVQNPWVEPNRIAWKIAARNQRWYLKRFHMQNHEERVFHLDQLKGYQREYQLSCLAFWLYQAEANQETYGLQLDKQLPVLGSGARHLRTCLQKLAVYP